MADYLPIRRRPAGTPIALLARVSTTKSHRRGEKEIRMRVATRQEIEYLGSADDKLDARFMDEMSRQLDALRRYDQYFCDADWLPENGRAAQRANIKTNF
jgi:hypothetical protein